MQKLINHAKQFWIVWLFCITASAFAQQSAWQQMADMPKGRKTCAADAIDGKIYIMCADSKRFMEYDPATNEYKNLADMPSTRSSIPTSAAANGLFYAIGGNTTGGGAGQRAIHAYDPLTDAWKKVADMPTGRYMMNACACENKVYTGGAYYIPKVFEVYDPETDTWDERSDEAPPLAGHAMCAYQGKVYCFGGSYGVHRVWEYNPDTNVWTRKADMPTGRSCAAAACVNGKIYVFGGTPDVTWPWDPPINTVEAYDPKEDKWYTGYQDMPTPRFWSGVCVLDSLIYVIGGFQGNAGAGAQRVNEVFNPALVTGEEYNGEPDELSHYWELQFTGITGYPSYPWAINIAVVDENVVWAGADRGVVLRTKDGGKNWNHAVVSGAQSHWFTSIAAINQQIAYFTAGNNAGDTRIYKTTDGGQSWEKQYQLNKSGAYINYIAFWDEDNGVAVGDPVDGAFLILTTTDGGATWVQTPADKIPAPVENEWGGNTSGGGTGLAVAGEQFACFCTSNGSTSRDTPLRAFRSSDRGQTWSVTELPFAPGRNRYVMSVVFQDSLIGFAGLSSDANLKGEYLAKTTDGGASWNLVQSFIEKGGKINTLCSVPDSDNKIIAASCHEGFMWTFDGGNTWHRTKGNSGFRGLGFVSPTRGWSTTWPGLVGTFVGDLSSAPSGPDVWIEGQHDAGSVESFSLQQNYPNPFNPTTTIEFTLNRKDHTKLAVYDLLGREVKILVDERLDAGHHRVEFDASRLPSGLYFYRLQSGAQVHTRKLTLIK